MKRAGAWALFAVFLYVTESSLLPLIGWREISADLLLAAVVSVSFLLGSREGVVFGFFAGLLQDLATGTFFGVNVFCKMVIGYGVSVFSGNFVKEQVFLPVLSVMAATAANYLMTLLFMILMGYDFGWRTQLYGVLLTTTVYNAVFALPVHFMTRKLIERLDAKK